MPVTVVLHTVIGNRKAKNGLLLAASLLFYAYGEPIYIGLMLVSTLFNYLLTLWLAKHRSKLVLALVVVVNIGILGVFKYSGFLMSNLNSAFGLQLPVPQIPLPIGISFFTFQAMSYVIDVYRKEAQVQTNYSKLLLYIFFFPQLIAGPIVRYADIARQIDDRTVTIQKISTGLRRFILGLGKKVLIANAMGATADYFFNHGAGNLNMVGAWIGAIAYIMQIYYDFSGYSDMAIGLGRVFGFQFRENFRYPYVADSVQAFWRRWHISLSTWFRDYVYIPLGGNRKGKLRTILNRLIIFFLTGLWHGANWTFIIWGLFHGFFLLLEEFVPLLKKLPKLLRHVYTLVAVTIGFVIFRADSITEAMTYVSKMFAGFDFSAATMSHAVQALTPYFLFLLTAAVVFCGPLESVTDRMRSMEAKQVLTKKESAVQTAGYVLAFLLLGWCMIRLAGSSYNPFIYFRF